MRTPIQSPEDVKLHVCDNCHWEGPTEKLESIDDLSDRIEAGSIVPSGECPQCQALCYPAGSIHQDNAIRGMVILVRDYESDTFSASGSYLTDMEASQIACALIEKLADLQTVAIDGVLLSAMLEEIREQEKPI